MNSRDMIKHLTELREELYDKESSILRLYGNREEDHHGNQTREIAKLRLYVESLDVAISQLKKEVK